MTLRERTKAAIAHKNIDYVPINIEMTTNFQKNLENVVGVNKVDIALNNHMLRKKYKQNRKDGEFEYDIFNVKWMASKDGGDVGIVVGSPLKGREINEYNFPTIDTEFADSIIRDLEAEKDRYTMFSITMGFFERAWSLCGMEDLLMDMICEPERVEAVFENIFNHHNALLNYVLDRDFDALYFGDDWGQQQGLIMGPEHWRRYIKPHVAKLFAKAKSKGKQIVLHSCGDLRDIFGDLIEIGVDVYNTVQPEIYDLKALKREYGNDITFYGGISTQQMLPYATKREVEDETKRVMDIMCKNGGYILSPTHAVTEDIPVENILAITETAKVYFGK